MTLFSIPFTIASMVIAVLFAGGGHGTYWVAKLLFPYAMMFTGVMGYLSFILIAVALLQYPLYGMFLDYGRSQGTLGRYAKLLAGAHVLAVLLALVGSAPAFTP